MCSSVFLGVNTGKYPMDINLSPCSRDGVNCFHFLIIIRQNIDSWYPFHLDLAICLHALYIKTVSGILIILIATDRQFIFSKNLGTLWEDLGRAVEGEDEIEIGQVDCSLSKPLCSKLNIHSYPTFKIFYDGEEFAKYKGNF